jgi:tetratricopeptide (TPR) repeat protein
MSIVAVVAASAFTTLTGCDDPLEPDRVEVVNKTKTDDSTPPKEGERPKSENLDVAKEDGTLHEATDEQIKQLTTAKQLFLANDLAGAEEAFKVLIASGPLSPQKVSGYVALGQIYRETGRVEKAQALFERLVSKAPEIPEGHFMLARALGERGEATAAIKAYEKTLNLQPDYLQAYVELGGMYDAAGRTEDAQNIFFKYEKKIYELAGRLEKKDTPPEDKLHILDVFGFVDDDRASAAIVKSIADPNPRVRERAIYLALDFQLGEARPLLETLAKNDPDQRVRFAAKEAYAGLKNAPVGTATPTVVAPKK